MSLPLTLDWTDSILTVRRDDLPAGRVEVLYLEAYCRPGSHDRDWDRTVIPHRSELLARSDDGRKIRLRDTLDDGVVVEHVLTGRADEVDFRVEAHNPTAAPSDAHWAQPCVRVGEFAGCPKAPFTYDYLPRCFVFLNGRMEHLPTRDWATDARYTPGQVWAGPGVDPADVNPRPLSPLRPSCGLIGCVSGDGTRILATAWEPYQELFQGVVQCLHSDFRIGGLAPGETKRIRGKLYLVPNDVPALLERYERDFPEQAPPA